MRSSICQELYLTAEDIAEKRELLKLVNDAIKKLLMGGVQSYTIATRSLTRLNLNDLYKLRKALQDEVAADVTPPCLLSNTRVSVFDRR